MRVIIAVLIVFSALTCFAEDEIYRVYRTGEPVIATHIIKSEPTGSPYSYSVFRADQVVLSTHKITKDGRIYKTGKPILPIKQSRPPWPVK